MQCPDCGAYYVESDDFCGECGRPLKQAPPAPGRLTPDEAKDLPTMHVGGAPPPRPAPAAIAPKTPRQAAAPRKKTNLMPALILAAIGLVLCCLFAGGMALWIGSSSATPTPWPTDTQPPPPPTEPPLPTEPPPDKGASPAALIYADDFSDVDSGWDVAFENDTEAEYANGEYRLAVYRPDYVVWGNPSMAPLFGDIRVEVDARHVEGPIDNNFGVLVRYQDDTDDYIWFQISSDGYYSVDLREGGEWVTLVSWEESDAIRQGEGATNHLTVEAIGNQYSFYANDAYLVDLAADPFLVGNIGLAAGAFDEPGIVIHFDNVEVYER